MRFALAMSLLGWSVSLIDVSHAFREEIWEWKMLQPAFNSRSLLPEGMLHTKHSRTLRNSFRLVQRKENQECDPSLSDDADVGILSCGYNEYCIGSEDSSLGGRCVPIVTHDHLRRVEETTEGNEATPANETDLTLFEYFTSFCEYPGCTCTNLNEDDHTLNMSCSTLQERCHETFSRCGVHVTDCYFLNVDVIFNDSYTYTVYGCYDRAGKGDSDDSSICYYHQTVNDTTDECTVSLNGEPCSSCEVVPTFFDVYYCDENTTCYNITEDCFHFDCTNVKGGWVGNDCAAVFFEDYGCVECALCDAGEVVSFPDATLVSVSRSAPMAKNDTHCGDGPIINDVTLAECMRLQLNAEDVCGCVPKSNDGGEETKVPTQHQPAGNTTVPPPPTERPSETIALTSSRSIAMMTTLFAAVYALFALAE
ncbi:hypothetical protein IV203_015633 [Nitzschia inconspicua]|uniref:Uncharacterized protein n=1 Tax=Nitzschia inconspicua TaxID=303405 RepID=A0A9K3LB71_9STRA|nr:hypothetical protein IV203_015633 [Nitzschia inconspicua]